MEISCGLLVVLLLLSIIISCLCLSSSSSIYTLSTQSIPVHKISVISSPLIEPFFTFNGSAYYIGKRNRNGVAVLYVKKNDLYCPLLVNNKDNVFVCVGQHNDPNFRQPTFDTQYNILLECKLSLTQFPTELYNNNIELRVLQPLSSGSTSLAPYNIFYVQNNALQNTSGVVTDFSNLVKEFC